MKKILLSLMTTITLASCSTSSFDITGKSFLLTELNNNRLAAFNENTPPVISFKKGRVNATVGCNTIFAIYQTDKKGALTLSEGGCTRMYCPEESREDEFIEAFNNICSYTIEGDSICFKDTKGKIILKGYLKRQ